MLLVVFWVIFWYQKEDQMEKGGCVEIVVLVVILKFAGVMESTWAASKKNKNCAGIPRDHHHAHTPRVSTIILYSA